MRRSVSDTFGVAVADLHADVYTDTERLTVPRAERLTVTHAQPERIAVTYSDDDRRRFQRRIDQ